MALNDRYTKHLVVSDSATVNPSQMAENVILVNSAGQKISTKTDAELNSRFAPRFVVPTPTGNAVTDDANVQATLALAEAARGVMEFQACAPGVYYNLTTTINAIACDVDCPSSAEIHSSASPVVQIGSTSATAAHRTHRLPALVPTTSNTGIGLKITNASGCTISVPYTGAFVDSIVLKGENGKAVAYNKLVLGEIYYYTRGIVLTRATSGWSNQNTFVGGKVGCTRSGNAISTVRAVQMGELTDLTGPPDSNLFVGTSFEGDQPEYHLECVGYYNRFVGCRWETTVAGTARINWANVSDNSVGARYNTIEGGFNFYGTTQTKGSAAQWNKLIDDTTGITYLDGDPITRTSLFARKASDGTVTSSTTPAADADLLLALKGGSTYKFEAVLFVDSSTTADIQIGFTVPSGATVRWGQHALLSTAADAFGSLVANSAITGTLSSGGAGATKVATVLIKGLVVTSSAAGNLTLTWAQAVSEASNTKLLANSHLEAIRVG